jgi:hypothetical protein
MDRKVNTVNGVRSIFDKGYVMLPQIKQPEVRKYLMERCSWSHQTFHLKKNGLRKISPIEADEIESAFHKYYVDPWTGKQLI